MDDWTGRIIDNRYIVESVLGAGGMGLVLRARHKFTGEDVAIKVLKPELELDRHLQERFLNEARAPSAIGHHGIVRVLDAGKAPDGLLYLVMELLVGRSLRIPMARSELVGPELRRVMLELFDALGAAHARGFVHRDLKPDNVFLVAPSDTVKLLDFGIAKVLDASLARVRTATGATLGTPAYMSPEQLNDPSSVDARTDLWAAGIMCYEALSGQLPYRALSAPSLMVAIATKEPDPIRAHLPNVPPALETFFARALSRDPNGRFASTAEMAAAFGALPLGGSVAAPPMSPPHAPAFATGPTMAHGAPLATGPAFGSMGAPMGANAPSSSFGSPAAVPVGTRPGTPSGPSRKLLVGGIGAVALIVIIAVAASRGNPGPAQRTAIDARVVEVEPQQTPLGVPPPLEVDPPVAVTPPHDPPVAAKKAVTCKTGCAAAARCGWGSPLCAGVCANEPSALGCLERAAGGDCLGAAQCWFKLACMDAGPRGTNNCSTAMKCQAECRGDAKCGCVCASRLAPAKALSLLRVDTCAFNCGLEQSCIDRRCTQQTAACASQ